MKHNLTLKALIRLVYSNKDKDNIVMILEVLWRALCLEKVKLFLAVAPVLFTLDFSSYCLWFSYLSSTFRLPLFCHFSVSMNQRRQMQGRDTAPGRDTGRDMVKDRVREPGKDTARGRDTGRGTGTGTGTGRDMEWDTVRDRGRDRGSIWIWY